MRRYTRLMIVSLPLPVEIVSQAAQLDAAVKAMLGSRYIALDTESNSFHHYPEQLCLIQIATRHRVYIIDAIVLKEIAALKEVLDASIIKVVHGADTTSAASTGTTDFVSATCTIPTSLPALPALPSSAWQPSSKTCWA